MDRRFHWLGVLGLGIVAAASCGGNPDTGSGGSGSGASGGDGGSGASSSSTATGGGGSGGTMDPPAGGALFTDNQIIGIDIKLSKVAIDSLTIAPNEYTKADVDVTMGGSTTSFKDVGVRIKGKAGSLRTLEQKAAFIIKFNEYTKGQKLDGLTKLAVNNMVQDSSMIHERLGYLLFGAMDVPAARSGYARVNVNGELYGLYSTVESTSNNEFLEAHLGGDTGNLYEGAYGTDVDDGGYTNFDQDNGDFIGYTDIKELVTALDAMTPQNFMVEAPKVIDMDRYIDFAATEIYIGHWDGYAYWRNNYFIYRRPDNNLWTWIPWGIDQTFSNELDAFAADSRMQNLCVQSVDCRKKLALAYSKVISKASEIDLIGKASQVKQLIWQDVEADPRREYGVDTVEGEINQTINFLINRPQTIQAGLTCVDPTGIDADMDGTPGCGIDCDDNNPNVYPGAPEKCNFIDDDCNGTLDDDPMCPKCLKKPASGGGTYAYCIETRSWYDAEADCMNQGGRLVSFHSFAAYQEVANQASAIKMGEFWIGFNDQGLEGTFMWTDGTPANFTNWNAGEPNDYGSGEDCAEATPDGSWNDLDCNSGLRYVCKLP